MSDLAATNCGCGDDRGGCGCDNNCGCNNGFGLGFSGFGNNSCNTIIWIILLLACCGNGNNGWGRGGCNNENDSCWIIILLLLLNNGCGCGGC